jgi:primosomal protein N' (replication factor Y) (superfamily II helicase)
MPSFVEISVNVPQVIEVFHYHLPPELEGRVLPGHLVQVPFGKQRVHGVVLRQVDQPAVAQTRAVEELVDPLVALTRKQLALAEWMAENTLAPLSACINLMLPAGLNQMADTLYALAGPSQAGENPSNLEGDGIERDRFKDPGRKSVEEMPDLSPLQRRILEILSKRGPLRGRQIDRSLTRVKWQNAARSLVRRGLISAQPVLPPPSVQIKSARTAQLAMSPREAHAQLNNTGRRGSPAYQRRQAILNCLADAKEPILVSWVYAESGGTSADLRFLVEHGLVLLGETDIWRDPLEGFDYLPDEPPPLTRDQEVAWSTIREGLHQLPTGRPVAPFLLHGVTGSGKTEIYLQAVAEVIRLGKQAIVLVPEISLTPQTVRRFLGRFPGQVGLVHYLLSSGERYDTWRRAHSGQLSVVVGPRSALFTPLPDLALIVVDESHDDSYYQSESLPYYHAREVALAYARLAGAVALLGTATPDIVSQYRAAQEKCRYLHLPDRILAHNQAVQAQLQRLRPPVGKSDRFRPYEKQAQASELPPVEVVDMRAELKAGNRSIFSRSLQDELEHVLACGQQAILFLNRRGSATYVFCRDCGHSLSCPRCDIPLVYHGASFQKIKYFKGLICHQCSYQRALPKSCPQCGSKRIRQYGTGTEKVEAEVQSLFPHARTLRWDFDTTRQKGSHEIILSHFSGQRADVLIGTQMLAKGLDLPLVTLVGVILADVGLNLPDYRAAERSFQVLTQVAGRAGRSPLGGKVILQTFDPEHYVIRHAAQHDYASFYKQELAYRRQLGYPPFTRLVRLELQHVRSEEAEKATRQLSTQLQEWILAGERRATQIIGPVPCFFSRVNGLYRWQIVLRGPDPASLLRGRQLDGWRIEVDPPSLL